MNRRHLLGLATLTATSATILGALRTPALAQRRPSPADAVLNDPEAPVSGNPQGDVTIVAFLDYNCPFCKTASSDLDRTVATDGRIRLVYKDWPILSQASVYGAHLALAAKYQGRYDTAHKALMGIPGRRISEVTMREAVAKTDIDMARLDSDLKAHDTEIGALLKRNLAQADILGLQGTPVFLIGPFQVASALDYAGFAQVVADARARNPK